MKRQTWFILPDVLPYFLTALVLTLLLNKYVSFYAALIPGIFMCFCLYFFRNPQRDVDVNPHDVLSPADGKILSIEEVHEEKYIKGPAIKVSIFLSIFNVHVNRIPVPGYIDYIHYRAGKFLPAFKSHASNINERNYVGIRCENKPELSLLVVQITGFIARRIVCWVNEGDYISQGQRFGLIKFGSCTEIYLPKGSKVFVEKGQKVKGGETIIGRLKNE